LTHAGTVPVRGWCPPFSSESLKTMNTTLSLFLLAVLSQANAQNTTPAERRYTEAGGSVIIVRDTPSGQMAVREERSARITTLSTGRVSQ
jgi:hypothetical protein